MKKILISLFVILALLGAFVPAKAEANMPVVEVESFTATPQWWGGVVLNSGTLILRATVKPGDGKAHIVRLNGSTYVIQDMWECTSEGCTWEQIVPSGIVEIWFDSLATWSGFGPWKVRGEGNGLFLMEEKTYIKFTPTWDQGTATWSLEFTPLWASAQMPWEANFIFSSSCGDFSYTVAPNWESTVFTTTTTTATTEAVNWVLMHPNGDIVLSGETVGPSCPASPETKIQRVFIPLVSNQAP